MRRATITLALVVFLASSGCETSTVIKNQPDYLAMARAEIENYRVPDRKEFYGFVLRDELKGRENHRGTPDEETGGMRYSLPDPQGMFDFVVIQTDPKGVVLRIQFYKAFTSGGARSAFFNAVAETLKTTYPVYDHSVHDHLGSIILIRAAESDDDWLSMYSEYLKRKDEWVSSPSPFYYMLHPTLALVSCAMFEARTGEYVVELEFTSKEYYRAREFHKKELQQRLAGLFQTGPTPPLEEGHSSPELTTAPLEQQPAAQSPTLAQTDAEVVESWKAAAMRGDASAQCNLGTVYFHDEEDYKEALKWFTKAAEQQHALAQYYLAVMYATGRGVPQDYTQAVKWCTKAAEHGDPDAQHKLGLMYSRGKGVVQDYKEAVDWFTKAAEQGHAPAQLNLGLMYYHGKGVVQDYKEAVDWFKKAAEQGDPEAQGCLGDMYRSGKGVAQDYAQAVKWFTKAAEQGHAKAQFFLGRRYYDGQGVLQDHREAARWFAKAAEQGYAEAQGRLAQMHLNGQGVSQDDKEAARWFAKAAEQGYAPAHLGLSVLYSGGRGGVPQDDAEAYKWAILAATNGVKYGQMWKELLKEDMTRSQIEEGQRRAREFMAAREARSEVGDGPRVP